MALGRIVRRNRRNPSQSHNSVRRAFAAIIADAVGSKVRRWAYAGSLSSDSWVAVVVKVAAVVVAAWVAVDWVAAGLVVVPPARAVRSQRAEQSRQSVPSSQEL